MINPLILSSVKTLKIIANFNEPVFSIKDCKLTYRALNHYQSSGIISDNKHNKSGWRKLTGLELIWIEIIISLRELGISLENIIKIKYFLFSKDQFGSIDKADFINYSLEQEVALSVLNNYDLYLVIFSDFTCTFHDSKTIRQWQMKSYKNETHINLPLKPIIKEINLKIKHKTS
ncbi:MAG: hypothetical protein QMB65_07495 [Vicingaceae bacterium]